MIKIVNGEIIELTEEEVLERENHNVPDFLASAYMPPLTSRQFWLTALEMGVTKSSLVEQVRTHFNGDEAEAMIIEVESATSFSRDYPLVQEMAEMSGIEPYQLDAMWMRAASL